MARDKAAIESRASEFGTTSNIPSWKEYYELNQNHKNINMFFHKPVSVSGKTKSWSRFYFFSFLCSLF
jgi:hypothetical protein